jgi:hypothetical protein
MLLPNTKSLDLFPVKNGDLNMDFKKYLNS